MHKKITLFLLIVFYQLSFSQVGIGTSTPSPSSALEIKSTNSGLLIPRLALSSTSDTETIANPATSLLVYNTATTSDIVPGFYFWEGSWKALKATTSSSSGWNLTGNSSASTDYLGTNNYNSLVFKVNNNPFAKFHPNGGITIGNSASAKDDNSIAIGTAAAASLSNQATAVGPSSIASGFQSTALGYLATASNNSTIAMGISSKVSGFQSIGIGLSAISSTNNTLAIGNSAKSSGQQATAIGYEANASGQNSTAIGYQAIASQDNSVILGSSTNANNKIGIGTNTPDERLHVVGSIKIVDGTQGIGRVLTSDANGKATWVSPSATKSYADIYLGGSTVQSLTHNNNVNFGTTNASTTNITANTNNIKVSITGKYRITYRITCYKGSNQDDFKFNLYKGTTLIPGSLTGAGNLSTVADDFGKAISISGSVIVTLNANDEIYLKGTATSAGTKNINLVPNGCTLSVELID